MINVLYRLSTWLYKHSLAPPAYCSQLSFLWDYSLEPILKMKYMAILRGPPISHQWGWLSVLTLKLSICSKCSYNNGGTATFTFTFTFSHLADAFVQSDVQGREQSSYKH